MRGLWNVKQIKKAITEELTIFFHRIRSGSSSRFQPHCYSYSCFFIAYGYGQRIFFQLQLFQSRIYSLKKKTTQTYTACFFKCPQVSQVEKNFSCF